MFKSHTNGPITHGVKKARGTKVTNKRKEEKYGKDREVWQKHAQMYIIYLYENAFM